jgi:hypothetical protein
MNHSKILRENTIERAVLKQLNNDDYKEFKSHLLVCEECRNELLRTKLLFSAAELKARDTENKRIAVPFFIAIIAAMLRYSQKHVVAISIVVLSIASAVVLEFQYHFISSPGTQKTLTANTASFAPNNYLENIINTNLRSGNELNVYAPDTDFQFRHDKKNGFAFTLDAMMANAKEEEIVLKILSNNEDDYLNDLSLYTGKVKLTRDTSTTLLSLQEQLFLNQGLYYFILQYKNEIDYIYIARFHVR